MQDMTTACTGQVGPLRLSRWGRRDQREATVVPLAMQQALQLQQSRWVHVETGESVSRVFETIYTGASATGADTTRSHLTLPSQANATPLPGINLVAYESDCSSSISAALNADPKFTLPIGTLQAVLNSSYQNTDRYRLSVVMGRFVSPLKKTLAPDTGGASPLPLFPTALAIWLWYRDSPARVTQSHWITESFDGFVFFRQMDSHVDNRLAASAAGSGRALGLAGDADARIAAFVNSSLTARLHTIAYDTANGAPSRTPYRLPSAQRVAELITAHAQPVMEREHFSGEELLDNRPIRMRHSLTGLPQAECAVSLWSTSGADAVRLVGAAFNPQTGSCAFDTTHHPSEALVNGGGDLQFNLVRPFGDPSGPDLVLRVPPQHFTPSRAPTLRQVGGSPSPTPGPVDPVGLTPLTWTRQFSLVDRPGAQTVTTIDTEAVRIVCGTRSHSAAATATVTAGAGTERSVNLSVQGVTDLTVNAGTAYESCEVQGTVVYGLQNGDRVRKPFPAGYIVYAPRPAPRIEEVRTQPQPDMG